MAQTPLTPVTMKENNYAVQAGDLTLSMDTADNVNGNSFPATGKEILLIQNPDASPHTFTVTSVADQLGRTGDITSYSIPATSIAVIDMDTLAGWKQTNGTVLLAFNSSLIKLKVLRLP